MGKAEKILVLLGVLSLVALAAPDIGTFAAITIIGLPVALGYFALPAIFLFALLAYLFHRLLPWRGPVAVVGSAMLALGILALPPYLLNTGLHRTAASFTAGDVNTLDLPLKARSIASREKFRFGKNATKCDGFCLHALLTGTARRFLVVHTKAPHDGLSADEQAIAFWLEPRSACPATNFSSGNYKLNFPAVKGNTVRAADPVETLKLRISNGECLVSSPATLADADLIVSRGAVTQGAGRRSRVGFSLLQNTNRVSRISVRQKNAGAEFEEVFRQTQVRYEPFGWLLVPSPTMRGSFNVNFGWWRTESRINIQSRHQGSTEWAGFLTETLGLKLQLAGDDTKKKTLDKLKQLLDGETPPSAADWALFSQYFGRIGLGRGMRLGATDFELGIRMLNNKSFPAPSSLHTLVKYAERNAGEPELERLAGILLNRLDEGGERYLDLGAKPADQIKRLAIGIKALPGTALLPHKEVMLRLASRPPVRQHGYAALRRLSVFGEDAVPTLLELMKVGYEGGEHFYRKSQYQHPYLGGLGGLCQAGPAAATALPELRQLMADGKLPDHASYGRLLFTTLLRLGEDKEQVRSLFMAAARNKSNATDKRFDALAARAFRKNRRCYF